MKKIIHILLLITLLFASGNVLDTFAFTDDDRDSVNDENNIDKDPLTRTEDIPFVCLAIDIVRHETTAEDFIPYRCEDDDKLGVFSQLKKDSLNDRDDDGINDLYDRHDDTKPENIRFICKEYDIKKDPRVYTDCGSNDLGRFSSDKKDRLFDTDRDGVKDFEDKQPDTQPEEHRRYVCLKQDIQRSRFGCGSNDLGRFSSDKKAYVLDGGFMSSGAGGNLTGTPGGVNQDGVDITNGGLNLDTGNIKEGVERNDALRDLQEGGDGFWTSSDVGERGIYDVLVTIARDIKNIFFAFATVFYLYIVLRLLLSDNSEEDIGKFKKGLLWITIGIIIMQIAFSFVSAIYDGGLGEGLAGNIIGNVLLPLIALLETIAAFFFIAMAIIAFYRLITSNGEEQAATEAKTTIINALLGYIVVRAARFLVDAVYVKSESIAPSNFSNLIVTIINWMNGFVAIAVIIMILYTGSQVLLSGGEEEKLTSAKKSLIYIMIGVALLFINFLILTFFFNAGI